MATIIVTFTCYIINMATRIDIPHVSRDERIGSVFNEMFKVIYATDNSDSTEVEWDFSHCAFFHPFFIAPLAIYKQHCGKSITATNRHGHLDKYLNLIKFDNTLDIHTVDNAQNVLNGYLGKSYIPICRFVSSSGSDVDCIQSVLQKIIERQSKMSGELRTPLSYMLGEIVGNIEEHAYSKYGYIYSQYLPSEKAINICIADAGITIHGSYVRRNRFLDKIGDNEAFALRFANDGYSTKDLPGAESRGFGISTSKRMLVDGLGGQFFMLSGGAFHRYDTNGSVFVNLPPDICWNGTITLMRIPVSAPAGFDYHKYVK